MIPLLNAGVVSMIVSLFGTRLLTLWLIRHNIGRPIRSDGPQGHAIKSGTPTMGGIGIVTGAFVGYLTAHLHQRLYFTRTGLLVMGCILGAAFVGFCDDWIKVVRERNLGLNKRMKMFGLLTVAIGFSVLLVNHTHIPLSIGFTRWNSWGWKLTPVLFVLWAVFVILAMTNGSNLADGLDGLNSGSAVFGFMAYLAIAFWAFRHPAIYRVEHALDLAAIAAAMVGGCLGFLWWNAAPARIFMGDTGSLAIGAGLASLGLTTNTHFLLPVICGLFVAETMSVLLQVFSFQVFGRRIFRMAPFHHHFELKGWPETTVIIRFWIIAGLCTAIGLGIFYADFISLGGVD